MRKFLAILFSLVALGAFAAPKISILSSNDTVFPDGTTLYTMAMDEVRKDFPGAELELIKLDLSDGSTLSMDALLAAGTPPNIYTDNIIRVGKYMLPEFALPLDDKIRDLKKYNPGVLNQFTRGGRLLGMPGHGGAQGMCINLDIMKDIGFTVKWDWTIDDFLKMAELVKQKYGGKKWATGMFAANQSGDYLLHNWFYSFGAEYYQNGNYNVATIAKTGGAKAYVFFQLLASKGYIPPNSNTLNDDDYAAQWMVGDLAATAFYPGWTSVYFKTAMDQKLIDKPFNYAFVPFPRGPGVSKVPTYSSIAAYLVHRTGTEADKVAARFVEYVSSAKIQSKLAAAGYPPNRTDAVPSTDPYARMIAKIVNENGIYDCGLTDQRFTERRAIQFPILQKVLTMKAKPEEAIAEYEKKLSAVK